MDASKLSRYLAGTTGVRQSALCPHGRRRSTVPGHCGLRTIELDRDFAGGWGQGLPDAFVKLGETPTLRTGNDFIWVVGESCLGAFSRCLHPVERLALQGYPPGLARYMKKRALLRATGNAFCVPVVAAVLRQVIRELARACLEQSVPPLLPPCVEEERRRFHAIQAVLLQAAQAETQAAILEQATRHVATDLVAPGLCPHSPAVLLRGLALHS